MKLKVINQTFPCLLLLAALLAAPLLNGSGAYGGDRRPDANSLIVMTYNAEFLWDGKDPEEGRVEFPWKNDEALAGQHMQRVADVIKANNPDIINLVEVESLAALEYFNTTYLAGSGYNAYLVKGKDSYTGEDVGILTRIDPEDGAVHRDDREGHFGGVDKSVSKNQYAMFEISGHKIALVGIHYLARPDDASRLNQRMAQANATKTMISDLQSQGYEIILVGDFNDFAGNVPDIKGSTPITNVVGSLSDMGPSSADDLTNVLQFIPPASRFTNHYDRNRNNRVDNSGELSAIDHMLISSQLLKFLRQVTIDQSYDPTKVSDHFPLIGKFDFSSF